MTVTAAAGAQLYPNLRGDLDADPRLLAQLQALAKKVGKVFTVTSGRRSRAEQQYLWDHRATNPYPVAKPGTSSHETGLAADVTVDGKPIQDVYAPLILDAFKLKPLKGDAVHVELEAQPSYVGSPIGDVAGAIGDAGKAINKGADKAAGAVGGAAVDVAGEAAKATAGALVDLAVNAIGDSGARVLLSIALVVAAVVLIAVGAARALGVKQPIRTAAKAARTGAVVAAL